MIVALRATERQSQERGRRGMRDIVEEQLARYSFDGHRGMFPRTGAQKAGGNKRFGIVRKQLVTRDLFQYEPIVALVAVETSYDVVAVSPGIGALKIVRIAPGIRITNNIQPVPCPSFAIAL
jgi:hypothetical protein